MVEYIWISSDLINLKRHNQNHFGMALLFFFFSFSTHCQPIEIGCIWFDNGQFKHTQRLAFDDKWLQKPLDSSWWAFNEKIRGPVIYFDSNGERVLIN